MRRRFQTILYLSYFIVVISFFGVDYYTKQALNQGETYIVSLSYDHEVVTVLQDVLMSLQRAESNRRGYVITNSREYVQNYNTAVMSVQQSMQYLKQLNANGNYRDEFLDSLQTSINDRLRVLKSSIDLAMSSSATDDSMQTVLTDQGRDFMTSIRNTMLTILTERKNSRDDTFRAINSFNATTRTLYDVILIIVVAAVVALSIGTYFHFKRFNLMEDTLRREVFQVRQQIQHANSRYQDLKVEMQEKLKNDENRPGAGV